MLAHSYEEAAAAVGAFLAVVAVGVAFGALWDARKRDMPKPSLWDIGSVATAGLSLVLVWPVIEPVWRGAFVVFVVVAVVVIDVALILALGKRVGDSLLVIAVAAVTVLGAFFLLTS